MIIKIVSEYLGGILGDLRFRDFWCYFVFLQTYLAGGRWLLGLGLFFHVCVQRRNEVHTDTFRRASAGPETNLLVVQLLGGRTGEGLTARPLALVV